MSRDSHEPTLYAIADWWASNRDELPDADFRAIGLGEPSCFRCGWLPPVPDSAELRGDGLPRDRALRLSWRKAGRFLDKAHLADWCSSRDDDPSNIVPLCHYPCHHNMPSFTDRGAALDWVAAGPHVLYAWQKFTDDTMSGELDLHRSQLRRWYVTVLEQAARLAARGG